MTALPSKQRWDPKYTVLILCVGAYFSVRFVQLAVSAVLPSILEAFDVSRATIGIILGGMWIAYALTQLPSGVLSDRFGGRMIVLSALLFTSLAGVFLVETSLLVLFGAFVLVLGAGAGLYYNAATMLLTQRFESIDKVIGIHRIGDPGAELLAPPLTAAIAVRYDWRVALSVGVGIVMFILAMFGWRVSSVPPVQPEKSLRELFAPTSIGLLSRPTLANTVVVAMLAEFVGLTTMSLLPTFLTQHHGYTLVRAGILFSILAAIKGLFQPVGGWLSDRLSRETVLTLMMGAGVIGYGALSLTTAFTVAVPAVGLAGFAMSWAPPLQSRVIDNLAESEQEVGFGLIRTIYILAGALGTAVTGIIADVSGWTNGFLVLAALLMVAFLLLLSNNSRNGGEGK